MLSARVHVDRRSLDRHRLPEDSGAHVVLRDPRRQELEGILALRDVSFSGLSVILDREMPGLDVGDCLQGVEVRAMGRTFHGELLVMHLTPDRSQGSVCGGLFYPTTDDDLLELRALVLALDAGVDARVRT